MSRGRTPSPNAGADVHAGADPRTTASAWRHEHVRHLFLAVLIGLPWPYAVAEAQAPTGSDVAESDHAPSGPLDDSSEVAGDTGRAWWSAWTEPATEDRIIWGMWTVHVNHLDEGWSNDRTFALIHRGLYAATFRTTHGPRAYTVGFERSWLSAQRGPLGGMLGFRTGLVYGYDGRLGWMAEKYPVLPFVQPVLYTRVGPLATDLTYSWVVVSVTAAMRF